MNSIAFDSWSLHKTQVRKLLAQALHQTYLEQRGYIRHLADHALCHIDLFGNYGYILGRKQWFFFLLAGKSNIWNGCSAIDCW